MQFARELLGSIHNECIPLLQAVTVLALNPSSEERSVGDGGAMICITGMPAIHTK